MSEKITGLTEASSADTSNDFLVLVDVSDTTQAATGTNKKIHPDNLGISSTTESKTGTSIVFTEDAIYNADTPLESGNLTLSDTGAVFGSISEVHVKGYTPTISGLEYAISGGAIDSNTHNIISMQYIGTTDSTNKVDITVRNWALLTAPSLTLTAGDEEIQVDWSAITDADSYVIEMDDNSGFTSPTEIYSGALLTHTETGLTNGTTYYFRGKSIGGGYAPSAWSTTESKAPSDEDWVTGLVAGYNLNSDGTDYTGNHDASTFTGITHSSAKVGNGGVFDPASNPRFVVTDHDDLSFNDGSNNDLDFTMAFWVSLDALNQRYVLVSKWDASNLEYIIRTDSSEFQVRLFDNNADTNVLIRTFSTSQFTTSQLHRIVITYTASTNTVVVYLDKVSQSLTNADIGTYSNMDRTTANVYIGHKYNGFDELDGMLDQIQIYNGRVWTQTDVDNDYDTQNAGTETLP